jgi:hypothetical protein
MKRLLGVCVVVAWAVLGGTLNSVRVKALAGEGPRTDPRSAGNGDVNGDRAIDISDASYLLGWLFLGGPEPVACPEEDSRFLGLPDTGQTTCYDYNAFQDSWALGPCDSSAWPSQDGLYATGCSSRDRFVDNGDGTVTDTCTGLMWQRETADPRDWCSALAYCQELSLAGHDDWRLPNVRELESIFDYGFDSPPSRVPVFDEVDSSYWSSTSMAGQITWESYGWSPEAWAIGVVYSWSNDDGDWHLKLVARHPREESLAVRAVRLTADESGQGAGLRSAGNGDVNGDRTIDISDASYLLGWLFLGGPQPVACPGPDRVPSGLPETGQTMCSVFYTEEDLVNFQPGAPAGWYQARCERAECLGQDGSYLTGCPSDAGRYVDNGDGTVTDTCTGLMWKPFDDDDPSGTGRWTEALAYCDELSFAGYDDWRLPNVRELQSIVDYGRVDPAIDPIFVDAIDPVYSILGLTCWSSTTSFDDDEAFYVYFSTGGVGADRKSESNWILAVRDTGPRR